MARRHKAHRAIRRGGRPARRARRKVSRFAAWKKIWHHSVQFILGSCHALFVLLLVGGMGGLGWLIYHGDMERVGQWIVRSGKQEFAAAGLRVEDITVSGVVRTDPEALTALLSPLYGQPLWEAPLDAIERQVRGIPWVESSEVYRQLPSGLHIHIIERQPVARWEGEENRLYLVDAQGVLIPFSPDNTQGEMFGKLPLLKGEEAHAMIAEWLHLMERNPVLAARVVGGRWVHQRRWDIYFEEGATVQLPGETPFAAWDRLARLEETKGILKQGIARIDMRVPDRLLIRLVESPQDEAAEGSSAGAAE